MRFSQSQLFEQMNEVSPTQICNTVRDELGFIRNWTGNIDDHKAMIEKVFGMYFNAGLPDRDLVSEKIAKKDYSGAANLMLSYAGGGNVDWHDFNQASGYKSKGYNMQESTTKIDKTSLIKYATEQGKKIFGNSLSYEKVESMVRHALDLTREQAGNTDTALGILRSFFSEGFVNDSSLDDLIDEEIAPEFGLDSVEEFEDVDFDDLEEAAKGKGSAKAILQKAIKSASKKYKVDEPEAKSMIFGRLRKLRKKPKGKRRGKKNEQVVAESEYNDKSISAGGAAKGSFPHEPTVSKVNPIDKRKDYLQKKNKDNDVMSGEDEGDEDSVTEGRNDVSISSGGAAKGSFPHEPTVSKVSPQDCRKDYTPSTEIFFKDIESGAQKEFVGFASGKVDKKALESFMSSEISFEEFIESIVDKTDDNVIDWLDDFVYESDDEDDEDDEGDDDWEDTKKKGKKKGDDEDDEDDEDVDEAADVDRYDVSSAKVADASKITDKVMIKALKAAGVTGVSYSPKWKNITGKHGENEIFASVDDEADGYARLNVNIDGEDVCEEMWQKDKELKDNPSNLVKLVISTIKKYSKKNEQAIDEGSAGIQRYGAESNSFVNYGGEKLPIMVFMYTDPTKGTFLGMGGGAYPQEYDVPNGVFMAYVYSKTDGVYIWAWDADQEGAVKELMGVFA